MRNVRNWLERVNDWTRSLGKQLAVWPAPVPVRVEQPDARIYWGRRQSRRS